MGGIIKLNVHVCKGSNSSCIIRDKLQVFEIPQVSDIHIGDTLVSEQHDIHQVEQIYVERFFSLLLHLSYMISLAGLLCLPKTLLANILQRAKQCLNTICPFHMLPCLDHNNSNSCTIMSTTWALNQNLNLGFLTTILLKNFNSLFVILSAHSRSLLALLCLQFHHVLILPRLYFVVTYFLYLLFKNPLLLVVLWQEMRGRMFN